MSEIVLVCTDGSDESVAALRSALGVVRDASTLVLVTAEELPDQVLLMGTGYAGPAMTQEEYDAARAAAERRAADLLADAAERLDLPDASREVLDGSPGPAICAHAEEVGAHAIVIGTRGQGGIKRALLGSVSDHVVRHAPCPVIVARPDTG